MGSDQDHIIFRGVDYNDHVIREGAHICLLLLRRRVDTFVGIVTHPECLPKSPYSKKDLRSAIMDTKTPLSFEFSPSWARNNDGSGSASMFVGLFSLYTGLKVKDKMTCVGVVGPSGLLYEVSPQEKMLPTIAYGSWLGDRYLSDGDAILGSFLQSVWSLSCSIPIHQVSLSGLLLKLKAANDLGITVVVPRRQLEDLLALREKEGYAWLLSMMEDRRLLYADNVMELLELLLEGESHGTHR